MSKKLDDINACLSSVDFANVNLDLNKNFSERSKLSKVVVKMKSFNDDLCDIIEFFNLAKEMNDFDLLNELLNKFTVLKNEISMFEYESMFFSPDDVMNSFFDIQAGSGGVDAQDWVDMLFKMYTCWFEKHGFVYDVLGLSRGEVAGTKSVSMKVSGKYSFGWLKNETGIHRLVRKSPFDSNNKRHTSFASVFVYPDNDTKSDIILNDGDLKIDTYRSSGAGGQHVNTTESAVRITHVPTGVVVQCQSDRSQHKNKAHAIRQLKLKLHAMFLLDKKQERDKKETNKASITWGNQIRSYVLDKSRIKDLRTNFETSNISLVLGGNLDPLVFSVLDMKRKCYEY